MVYMIISLLIATIGIIYAFNILTDDKNKLTN